MKNNIQNTIAGIQCPNCSHKITFDTEENKKFLKMIVKKTPLICDQCKTELKIMKNK